MSTRCTLSWTRCCVRLPLQLRADLCRRRFDRWNRLEARGDSRVRPRPRAGCVPQAELRPDGRSFGRPRPCPRRDLGSHRRRPSKRSGGHPPVVERARGRLRRRLGLEKGSSRRLLHPQSPVVDRQQGRRPALRCTVTRLRLHIESLPTACLGRRAALWRDAPVYPHIRGLARRSGDRAGRQSSPAHGRDRPSMDWDGPFTSFWT